MKTEESIKDLKKRLEKEVIRKMFKTFWQNEIRDYGMKCIEENKADYFDGYTAVTEESYEEVFQSHIEEFIDGYAEQMGEKFE